MALVSKEIPALWNGISQQPGTARSPTQSSVQVNCYPTVVDGVRKRPPAQHVSKITSSNIESSFIHTINRDVTRRFIVVLTNGDLKVYGLDGTEKTVAFPYGKAYLAVTSALSDFGCVTVADYTFILNKVIPVSMMDVGDDTADQPEDYWWLNRQYPAELLASDPQFSAVQYQYGANPTGGTYRGEKQSFEQLADEDSPANGDIWRIHGTDESAFATYYVRRVGSVWEETVAPDLKNRLNAESMPWALVHLPDDTFVFAPFSWADRRVGDETTNPNPTFVGRTIRDIFFYKNRLGLAVEEGAVCSRIGDFGNFYRMTVLQLLPDEVTDLQASETKVTKIAHVVPFNTGMMMFSDQVQFRVTEGDTFGPGTSGLKVATEFPMKLDVKPEGVGTDVYFAVENGQWAQIREYFVRDNAVGNDAADITGHVPKYIPAGVKQIKGSAVHDALFVTTSGAPTRIYLYKFFWTDETTKVQSAWGHWEFDSDVTVLSMAVLDNDLFVILKRADGAYLERISLSQGAVAYGLDFDLFLDRRYMVLGTWLIGEGKTEFELPYPVAEEVRNTFRIVRGAAFTDEEGAILSVDPDDYEWVDSTHVKVETDFSDGPCFVGKVYEQRHTFSPQYMRDAQNVAIVEGVLTLLNYGVYFTDTAYFKTEVSPYGVPDLLDTSEYVPVEEANFDAKTVGEAALVIGAPVAKTGKHTFGVGGDGDVAIVSLVNSSPYGATFTSAEWEAIWNKRARVVG